MTISPATIGLGAIATLSLIGNGVLFLERQNIARELTDKETGAAMTATELRTSLETATAQLGSASTTIAMLEAELAALGEEYEELEEEYEEERGRNEEFADQIRAMSKTVGTLDKLSKTDEELLQKYSRVYFLNENYVPSRLATIPTEITLPGRQAQEFHADALPFLEAMIKDAARDGIDLKVLSAYRSFDEQEMLKGAYTQRYGSGANAFSADQGYSEHQLGTTVDLSDPETGGPYTAFKDTEAYQWLLENAYKHGFVLSYPEDNGYYIFEPWHWRFVGEDLAEYLFDNNLHFYDLDQRTIDTYLVRIFD